MRGSDQVGPRAARADLPPYISATGPAPSARAWPIMTYTARAARAIAKAACVDYDVRRHGIRLLAARPWSAGRRGNDPQTRDESRVTALLVAVRHRSRRASRVDGPLDVSVLDDGAAAGRRRARLSRAAGDDGLARARDEPHPSRHERARRPLSQSRARRDDARDDRSALGRARYPRRW